MNSDQPFGAARPLAPPIVPSAVYAIPDLDTLDRISEGRELGYIYARDKHPNAADLAIQLAQLESAEWGVVASSGMGAMAAVVLAGTRTGDRLVASDQLYGRTSQFLTQELTRFGVTTTYVDTLNLNAVQAALAAPARFLLVETISNPLLRVADLPRLVEIARDSHCQLIVDNTFATPILCRPIDLGAPLVIESLTKQIGGHSDLTLGFVCGRNETDRNAIAAVISIWGMNPSPFDCWLGLRSLPTLELRVKSACAHAEEVARWLVKQRGIRRVVYPGAENHPDHALATRLFPGPPGNMIACELEGGRPAVDHFLRHAPNIPFCPSLGDTHTTMSYPIATSHRFVAVEEKARLGITEGLIRFSIGIESPSHVCEQIARGLGN